MELMASDELYATRSASLQPLGSTTSSRRRSARSRTSGSSSLPRSRRRLLVNGRKAGALALTIVAWALRLCGIALVVIVVALSFSGVASRLGLVNLVDRYLARDSLGHRRVRAYRDADGRGLPSRLCPHGGAFLLARLSLPASCPLAAPLGAPYGRCVPHLPAHPGGGAHLRPLCARERPCARRLGLGR